MLFAGPWKGWRVIAMDVTNTATDLKELPSGVPTLVVVGSEGRGLREAVRAACGQTVTIANPNASASGELAAGVVDSLNVSNAVACTLYHLLRVKQ
jgi:tRNA G18 (ribose-2'-O)-methylase SpoU